MESTAFVDPITVFPGGVTFPAANLINLAVNAGNLGVDIPAITFPQIVGNVDGTVERLQAFGAIVGLATGNTRDGARLKLTSAGLGATFDLSRGAYGCDAEARADIVRLAAVRCGARDGEAVVVVGDTERDVHAGRAIGARVVGIATDDAARRELLDAGADAIVETCGDALVAAILAQGR